MIGALVAFAALAPIQLIEVPDPSTDRVAIQAVLKLPPLEPLGRAEADVLAQVVTGDNDNYARFEMRNLSAPGGAPKAYAMPDHLSIQLSVLPADTGAGMRMLAAIVSSARLELGAVNKVLVTEPYRHKPAWSLALDSSERAWDRMRANDISNFYRAVFRPDNISVAVGGPLKPGVAQRAWNEATENWRRQRSLPLRQSPPFKEFPLNFRSNILELRGPEIESADAALAPKMLALIALGSGKASSLFRVIREDKAISYRQEAVFWPTTDGFVPRLFVQVNPVDSEQRTKLAKDVQQLLLGDIGKWNEETLRRAQGFASSLAMNGSDLSPFYFKSAHPLGTSIEDRTFLAAYWKMKTGQPWDGQAMSQAFQSVSLESLKAEAEGMLKVAIPLTYPKPD